MVVKINGDESHGFESVKNWLVVSTHLKNISQTGSFPQVGVKMKHI